MTLKPTILSAAFGFLFVLIAGPGFAIDDTSRTKPITYAGFAAKVPHLTLSECPEIVSAKHVHCHVATIDGALHVLAFANAGDQRLVSVHSELGDLDADGFRLSAKY